MVLRRDARGVLAVGQAAHAWLCGQFARAWGNARFRPVAPLDEVALGAEQHDIGMARWDLRPVLNPATGLPQSFIEMPLADNLALWRAGPSQLITQSRYAALLATMHGRRLYERRDLAVAAADEAELVIAFLDHSHRLEARLLETLRSDPAAAVHASGQTVERNSRLVWTWDTLSLALLLDWAPLTLREVPVSDGDTADVELTTDGSLDPWPFATDRIVVHCDGRRLLDRYRTADALVAGLDRAPWETIHFTLAMPAPIRRRPATPYD